MTNKNIDTINKLVENKNKHTKPKYKHDSLVTMPTQEYFTWEN